MSGSRQNGSRVLKPFVSIAGNGLSSEYRGGSYRRECLDIKGSVSRSCAQTVVISDAFQLM